MKKQLAILLIFSLLAGLFALPAAAFGDTEGLPCEEAVDLLYTLGIVEGRGADKYMPEEGVSRAEMITYVLRLLGVESIDKGTTVFEDVTEDHWAYGNIASAYNMGLVRGVSETEFSPDTNVTFSQAVKILVSALGYSAQAESFGGYPAGYLIMANRIELLKGVAQDGENINRGMMAQLSANALDIHPSAKLAYGADNGTLTVLEDETLLSLYLGVDTFKGRITANGVDRVSGSVGVKSGEIALDDVVFSAGATDAAAYIGREVILRAKKNGDTYEILHVKPKKGTEVVKVRGKDIRPETNANMLYVDTENGKESYTVSGALFVYNGTNKASWDEKDLLSSESAYTLILGSDGNADVIFCETYTNYVIKSASPSQETVIFKDGSTLSFDPNKYDAVILTKEDGTVALIDEMTEWDILSVSKNQKGTVLKAVLGKTRVEGEVSEMSADEVKIGEKSYLIADSLLKSTDKKPAVGKKAIFSLDAYGFIAAVNDDTLTANYGYLIEKEDGKGLNGSSRIKIYTTNGKFEVFPLAEKVSLNGDSLTAEAILKDAQLVKDGAVVPQLLTYEKNEAGEIIELRTAVDATKKDKDGNLVMTRDERLANFSKDFVITKDNRNDGRYIGHTTTAIATRYRVAAKTVIMKVPENPETKDEAAFSIMEGSKLAHDTTIDPAELYDVDKNNTVSVILWKTVVDETTSPVSYAVCVFDSLAKKLTDKGDVAEAINAVDPSGTLVSLTLADDVRIEKRDGFVISGNSDPERKNDFISLDKIEKGDILQYTKDASGNVKNIAVRVRANYSGVIDKNYKYFIEKAIYNGADTIPGENYNYFSLNYLYGTLGYTVENGVVTFAPIVNKGIDIERLFSGVNGKILIYDKKTDKISKAALSDLCEGDEIAVLRIIATTVIVVAYRK